MNYFVSSCAASVVISLGGYGSHAVFNKHHQAPTKHHYSSYSSTAHKQVSYEKYSKPKTHYKKPVIIKKVVKKHAYKPAYKLVHKKVYKTPAKKHVVVHKVIHKAPVKKHVVIHKVIHKKTYKKPSYQKPHYPQKKHVVVHKAVYHKPVQHTQKKDDCDKKEDRNGHKPSAYQSHHQKWHKKDSSHWKYKQHKPVYKKASYKKDCDRNWCNHGCNKHDNCRDNCHDDCEQENPYVR